MELHDALFELFQHQMMDFEFSLETQGLFGPGSVFAGSVRLVAGGVGC